MIRISPPGEQSHCCRKAFFLALLTAALFFIPFMIWDKGYFFFFGDFNVQQIPFYKLAHEAVRKGDIFWNWYTDLGANFIGSYSFYLIGSPFFWLTLPFPTEFVPHLMAPLLILKHACAAFTSCLYLKRFVRKPEFAVLGSLLYAFSGYAVYNIFFNHFHEAIIFFPLLLVGLEELMVNNRRGFFAAAVAVNAFVNYWFFIGEVVFTLLYFAVRAFSPEWRMRWGKFFLTAWEAVLGMLLSMALFLPSVMAIMGNPRTGSDELLQGWNLWLYWHNQLYPAIVSSAFFPPDLPSRPNLFPDRGAKWASLSAWLPMIGMCGVIGYLKSRRDWLRRLLLISFLFALVPALNSAFILFNNSYYARWYYMPLLLMALATARALESPSIKMKKGIAFSAAFVLLVTFLLAITPVNSDEGLSFGLTKYPARFAAIAAISIIGLAVFCLLWVKYRRKTVYVRNLSIALCAVTVIYSGVFIGMGKCHSDDTGFIRDVALDGRYELELDESAFARSDLYKSMDNLGMYWHLPNLQAFHSVVPTSIMEFYPKVDVKRDVSSKPEVKYYQLRSFLSTRWFFVKEDEKEQKSLMPGWRLYDNQLGYNIYENKYWIPMGFTYDYYITVRDFEQIDKTDRAAVLLRALVLKDEAEERHDDILEHMPKSYYDSLTQEDYYTDCDNRIASAGSSFTIDNHGFESHIDLPRENLVFYSVPYDKGWSATVNGEPALIEKVDIGFMAVRAPAGSNTIRFKYTTPGLYPGILFSLSGVFLLIAYLLWSKRRGYGNAADRPDAFDTAYSAQTAVPYGQPLPNTLEEPDPFPFGKDGDWETLPAGDPSSEIPPVPEPEPEPGQDKGD